MLGFKPGFAYLGLVPPQLECARHATPRVRVPAGSVALAGRQTGIYPVARPAAGSSSAAPRCRLFDPWREEPSLVVARRPRALRRRRRAGPSSSARSPQPRSAGLACRSRARAGLLTTRAGRGTLRAIGAGSGRRRSRSTATALAAANRAVGNRRGGGGARVHGRRGRCSSSWRPSASRSRAPTSARCSSAPTSAHGRCRAARASSRGRATCCASRAGATGCRAYVASRRAGSTCRWCSALALDRPRVGLRRARRPRAARRRPLGVLQASGGDPRARESAASSHAARVTRRVVLGPQEPTTSPADTLERFLDARFARRRQLRPRRLPPRGRAAPPPRARRDPVGRHAARLDPGPARRPADRDARRRPDHRRLPEDRDGASPPTCRSWPSWCPGEGEVRFEPVRLEDL